MGPTVSDSIQPRAASAEASEDVEDVVEVRALESAAEPAGTARATALTAASAETAKLLAAVRIDLAAVKFCPLLGVAQQVEGRTDTLEPLFGGRIAGVLVGVQFLGQLVERLAHLRLARRAPYAQFLIGIARHAPPSSLLVQETG